MKTLGSIIKQYRTTHHLSLREFSNKCGISHTYINKLEKGADPRTGKPIEPTLDTVIKIAKALGKTTADLLTELGHIQYSTESSAVMNVVRSKVEDYIKDHPDKEDKAILSTLLIRKLFDEGYIDDKGEIDEYALNLLKEAIKMDVMISKKPNHTY